MTEPDHVINSRQQHHKIFYGWWIVGACFLVSLYNAGTITYGFTAFFEPIAQDFGWSYAAVSFAASIRGLESGFLTPAIGWLVDRLGPRRLMFGGAILTGLGLMLLSRTTSLGMFYAVYLLISTGLSTCAATVTMTAVANWFRRKVSIATGIMSSGTGLGGLLIPLITLLIGVFRWRTALVILGLGSWCIVAPLALIVRHKPEQYGYLPDGEVTPQETIAEDTVSVPSDKISIGAMHALKTRAFWHISLALALHMLVMMTVTTHIMPYLSTVGVARSTASLVASALPLTSIAGRVTFGWFGDRYDKRLVTAVGIALICLSMLSFVYAFTTGIWLVILFLILYGFGLGGPIPMTSALLREYFGKGRLGSILGLTIGVLWLGGITGPPLAGWIYDRYGNYQGAWWLLVILAFVAMVIMATTPPVAKSIERSNKITTG